MLQSFNHGHSEAKQEQYADPATALFSICFSSIFGATAAHIAVSHTIYHLESASTGSTATQFSMV